MPATSPYSVKANELFLQAEAQQHPLLRAGFAGMARAYLLLAERADAAPAAPDKPARETAPADA